MKKSLISLSFLTSFLIFSQEKKDSIIHLKEVILIGKTEHFKDGNPKMTQSVEDYLESSQRVNLIKRGAYSHEPMLNNMPTERSVITIDGMRIFGACTDKMDPVTSYVETNNLSEIDIQSGQEGSHCGATIAGNIDLKRKKIPFLSQNQWKGNLQTGLESNNLQNIWLSQLQFSSQKTSADFSFSYRKAGNYFDGNRTEILYSQYEKYNASLSISRKIFEKNIISADFILDYAKDVGYPTLPMDVSKAKALIGSVSFQRNFEPNSILNHWKTKLYANSIFHEMDDTTRPNVPVHMDMPGWSDTFGFFSTLSLEKNQFSSEINLNAFHNKSIAEMTMYYKNAGTMFMYTWPKVGTLYSGISIHNQWKINNLQKIKFGGNFGFHQNRLGNDIARIFYPDLPMKKNRILPSINAGFEQKLKDFSLSLHLGYGERAPSVSEGYGVYLFNSFDAFEYIGNPFLKNETAYDGQFSASFSNEKLKVNSKISYFFIKNYIVGKIANFKGGSTMMHGSRGLKEYQSLNYATQINFSTDFEYQFLKNLFWKGGITYAYGKDFLGETLPFIRPFSYQNSIEFRKKNTRINIGFNGDLKQKNYNPNYGEDATNDYFLVHFSIQHRIKFNEQNIEIQTGVENLLNRYYSTYADWNNFPRMGRNIFLAVKYSF